MLSDLGLTVARSIPVEQLMGLMTGTLSLHGGVIRDAAGRIVSHLVIPSASSALGAVPGVGIVGSIINGIRLQSLSTDVAAVKAATEQVLNYSIASAALSGLGLVTSVTGFAYLAHRLNRIDKRLGALEKQTKSIKRFLQSTQHSQLLHAIDSLKIAQGAVDTETRRHLLIQCKQTFGTLAHQYRSMLDETEDLAERSATEDCYVLSVIGNVTTSSDLGLFKEARDEMQLHYLEWKSMARNHCGKLLLKDNPERLMDPRYLKSIPAANLLKLLDFANNTNRGLMWIDDLRANLGTSTFVRGVLGQTELPVIEYCNKLLAKNDALDGFTAHMAFLAEKRISLFHFARNAEELSVPGQELLVLTRARAETAYPTAA
ncbi:hypothetical protein ACSFA3_12210 [Variovorax sp. RHLX14]|uniref:hypothetical protein n=1 Tax=Variovorax sp. RHLX14 TaxID=1259731 RepID=UPI003F45A099